MKGLLISTLLLFCLRTVCALNITALPTCGQYCVTEVTNNATANAICGGGRPVCYCSRADFQNQVTICASQQCTSDADKSAVDAFAVGFCENGANGAFGPYGTYTASNTPTPTPSATVTVTSAAAQTSSSSQTDQRKSEIFSTGVQAGIAVGVVVVVLSIGIIALLLWKRQLKQRKATNPESQDGGPLHEIDTTIEPKEVEEMWVPPVVHELPATRGASPALVWRPENRHLQPISGGDSPDISPEQQTVSPVESNDNIGRRGRAM